MNIELRAGTDGDLEAPEVQVSGTARALSTLGELLNAAHSETLPLRSSGSAFYPVNIDKLSIEHQEGGDGRINVSITNGCLRLEGNSAALNKLGDSLVNFFDDDAEVGEHFHLEYFEGNEILNETTYSLIFIRDR